MSASDARVVARLPDPMVPRARGRRRAETSASQGFGLVVHALADRIGKGELSPADDLMALVDAVWGQLAFRTPWSGDKERAEVEAALDRFVRWHGAHRRAQVLATEHRLRADVSLPDGATGPHHRVRRPARRSTPTAESWVVDLKTGKYPPTDKDLPANPQLGLYQLAVDEGAVDDLLAVRRRSGAPNWSSSAKRSAGEVKVQRQAPQEPDDDGSTIVESQLMAAAAVVRSEQLVARAGPHCDQCGFHAICPVKGAGTVLS